MIAPAAAMNDEVVPAGEPWMGTVRRGQKFRIVDLEGNQAVDTLFYNAADTAEHYSAQDTIQAQQRIYLTTGTVLLSNAAGRCCASWKTPAGATTRSAAPAPRRATPCVTRSRSVTCTPAATASCWRWRATRVTQDGMTKRDLPSNINFFMNVPVTPAGKLRFADGISAAGRHVEMRGADGRPGADFQLPATQQSLQRIQSDADSRHDLGSRVSACSHRRDDPSRTPHAGTTWRSPNDLGGTAQCSGRY